MSIFFDLIERMTQLVEEAEPGKVKYFSQDYPVIRLYSEDDAFIADLRAQLIAVFEADGLGGQVDEAEMSKPYVIDRSLVEIVIYNPIKGIIFEIREQPQLKNALD